MVSLPQGMGGAKTTPMRIAGADMRTSVDAVGAACSLPFAIALVPH